MDIHICHPRERATIRLSNKLAAPQYWRKTIFIWNMTQNDSKK